MAQTLISAYSPMPAQRCVAREGYPFIALSLVIVILMVLTGAWGMALFFAFLTIAIALFFRNPEREIPNGTGLIVSPADGRILEVTRCETTPLSENPSQRISIFLSIFDVHINRTPIAGHVKEITYHPGKFFVASFDKACEQNERNTMLLEDEKGRHVVMSQVAGLIARRIVCYLKAGIHASRGERMGLIRFGSRIDLYVPPECDVKVKKGDRVTGGSTVIGVLS